jgi:hypothetical protein
MMPICVDIQETSSLPPVPGVLFGIVPNKGLVNLHVFPPFPCRPLHTIRFFQYCQYIVRGVGVFLFWGSSQRGWQYRVRASHPVAPSPTLRIKFRVINAHSMIRGRVKLKSKKETAPHG